MRKGSLVALSVAIVSGCLEPQVSDRPTYSPNIARPGSAVPDVTTSFDLVGRIEGADGVSTNPVPRKPAFVGGAQVLYWDLGAAPRFAITAYELRTCDENGAPIPGPDGYVAHPRIVDALPGDPSYSPYFRLWTACVTERYAGEVLPSLAALEDAVTLGLVLEPEPTTSYLHMPILAPDVTIEVGGGAEPAAPDDVVYYRGLAVPRFVLGADAGPYTLPGTSTVLKNGRVYRLRKASDATFAETILSTPRRDSMGAPSAAYTPLFRVVNVTMASSYAAGTAKAESDLFTVTSTTITPNNAAITSFEQTDTYVDLDIQLAEGRP